MERIPSSSARISPIGRYADLDRPDGAESRGRHLICFKSMTDPIGGRVQADEARLLKTAMFRDDARRSETMLAGVAYQSYFDASSLANYPYRVSTIDLPFFKGTGYKVGDAIGDMVGYEWDNRAPEGNGNRLWDAAKSRITNQTRGGCRSCSRARPWT